MKIKEIINVLHKYDPELDVTGDLSTPYYTQEKLNVHFPPSKGLVYNTESSKWELKPLEVKDAS